MCPDPLSTVGTAIGILSAAGGGWEKIKDWIGEQGYDKALIEVAVNHVLSSGYNGDSRDLALEQLNKDSTVRRKFLAAATQEDFKSCLKRMSVLGGDTLNDAEENLLVLLATTAFNSGASRQELIQRSEIGNLSSQVYQLPEVLVEKLRREFSLERRAADEPADAVNRLLTDFPLLTRWTERLDYATSFYKQFTAEGPDFAAYSRLVEEACGAPATDLDIEIENIAVLCVEGQPEIALERLHAIESHLPHHDLHRHVLFHRLRGSLLLEVGRVPDANRAFTQAQRVLYQVPGDQKQHQNRAHLWLERKLAFDKLNTSQWSRDSWQRDYDKARAIPVWHTHPAIDRAVSEFERVLGKEAFEVSLTSESTFRTSSFLTEALLSFNRALLFAYLCGDSSSVKSVRREFAQSLAVHQRSLDDGGVKLLVDELLRTGDTQVISPFLKAHADRLAPLYDWAEVIERMKPLDPVNHDLGPYNLVRSRLVVIETMSPYFSATTLEALNEEFSKEAIAYLSTSRDGLVRGTSFIESYFIETFTRIENLKSAQLRRLVDALDGIDIQHRNSFWEVVAAHNWQASESLIAQMVIEQFEGTTLKHFAGGEVIARLMGKLGHVFPDSRPQVVAWLRQTATADESTKDDAYIQLLDLEEEPPAPEIKAWLLGFYHHHRDSLQGRLASENVLAMRRLLLIPYAAQEHPEMFSQDECFDIVKGLVEAAQHPDGYAVKKVDALRVACEFVPFLSDDQREAVQTLSFNEGLVQFRKSDALLGLGFDRIAVQANLLRLHMALGLPAGPDELKFIVQALAADVHSSTQSEVYLAAEALIKQGDYSETLLVALYHATFAEANPKAVRTAAQVLVRILPAPDGALHTMIVERLETLITEAAPSVKRALIGQLIESWAHLPTQVQVRFHARAKALEAEHQNRFIRSWAAELCRKAARK